MHSGRWVRATVPPSMSPLELLAAVLALVVAVCAGTVAHELLHAVVLRTAGVGFEIEWFGGARAGRLGGFVGTWASVRLRSVPEGLPAWQLRAASLAPLVLAVPLLAVPAGLAADPFTREAPVLQAAAIGWLACALPSPADFSLVWDADAIVADPGELVPDGRPR